MKTSDINTLIVYRAQLSRLPLDIRSYADVAHVILMTMFDQSADKVERCCKSAH